MWHHDERAPLWRNVSFTLMWTSTAASGFGDRMMMLAALALLGAMGESADSTAVNAATQFWFFLPYLLFSVFFGWLADHLPRKWVMFGCDETRALILLLAFLMVPAGMVAPNIAADEFWRVYAVLFMVGTAAALFNPTRNAIVPQIIPPWQLQSANAIIVAIGVVASMVGLVVGDFIIKPDDAVTVRKGLIFAVGLYAVSGTFFAFLRVHQRPTPKVRVAKSRTFKQGADYILHHGRVLRMVLLHALVWGGAMVVYAAVLAIGKVRLGFVDNALQTHFVWMGAILGLGMLAGAVVVAWIGTRRHVTIPMMLAMIVAGASVLVVVTAPIYPLVLAGAFLVGLAGNVAIIGVITLLQSITPNYIRGRVMGLDSMFNTFVSVTVSLIVWQMPKADRLILSVLYVLGPLLMVVGMFQLVRYLRQGPMPNATANTFRHIERWFCLVWHRLEWRGRHHIPRSGPVILACNHTTALDPLLLQAACPRMIHWLMLTSYRFKIFNPLWNAIDPVFLEHQRGEDRTQSGTKQVRQIVTELKKGEVVGIFPEGHLQYDDRVLKPFEPGAAVCARMSGAVIVPCWIEGTPLSRKMWVHFFKPTRCRIHFGEPLAVERKADPAEVTAELRKRMEALASKPAEVGHQEAQDTQNQEG